jgi:hypothetical protein
MRVIPVDVSRLKVLVVGEPAPQMRDGAYSAVSVHPFRSFRTPAIGSRVAADAGSGYPLTLTSSGVTSVGRIGGVFA